MGRILSKKLSVKDRNHYGIRGYPISNHVRKIQHVAYPYVAWTSLPVRILYRGRDYWSESKMLIQVIRNWGIKEGLDLSFKAHDHAIVIVNWSRILPKKGKR